jgi:hypothetical protein
MTKPPPPIPFNADIGEGENAQTPDKRLLPSQQLTTVQSDHTNHHTGNNQGQHYTGGKACIIPTHPTHAHSNVAMIRSPTTQIAHGTDVLPSVQDKQMDQIESTQCDQNQQQETSISHQYINTPAQPTQHWASLHTASHTEKITQPQSISSVSDMNTEQDQYHTTDSEQNQYQHHIIQDCNMTQDCWPPVGDGGTIPSPSTASPIGRVKRHLSTTGGTAEWPPAETDNDTLTTYDLWTSLLSPGLEITSPPTLESNHQSKSSASTMGNVGK